jgi:hypothetical protein
VAFATMVIPIRRLLLHIGEVEATVALNQAEIGQSCASG